MNVGSVELVFIPLSGRILEFFLLIFLLIFLLVLLILTLAPTDRSPPIVKLARSSWLCFVGFTRRAATTP
jgi:hypothetical protein